MAIPGRFAGDDQDPRLRIGSQVDGFDTRIVSLETVCLRAGKRVSPSSQSGSRRRNLAIEVAGRGRHGFYLGKSFGSGSRRTWNAEVLTCMIYQRTSWF